jgi:hypothetical protein
VKTLLWLWLEAGLDENKNTNRRSTYRSLNLWGEDAAVAVARGWSGREQECESEEYVSLTQPLLWGEDAAVAVATL